MKNCKVISNKGYYLGLLKNNVFETAMKLIVDEKVVFGVDNTVYMYSKDGKEIKGEYLYPEKEYMKTIAKYTITSNVNTEFKKINLNDAMFLYTQEQSIWIEQEYHLDLFLLPFLVNIENNNIVIYPVIKIYEDNIIIISYNINCYDEINKNTFEKLYDDINRKIFKKIVIPVNYAPKKNSSEKIKTIINEEEVEYVEVEPIDEFSNIIYFSKYLLQLFNINEDTGIFYGRCTYLLENDNKKVNSNFIDTLLKGAKGNYVHELKDYSINRDYKKYFNERATILLGKNVLEHESLIQAIEERMIVQTIKETIIYGNLKNNKYKYNELKDIYMDMLYREVDKRTSHYGEIEDIILLQHSFMNRDERLNYLKNCVETSIKDKESFYQERIALFALLLSAAPIVDYVLFPLINNVLHNTSLYNYIIYLKNTWIGMFISIDTLKMICFIIVIISIYLINKKYIKGKI